LRFVSQQRIEEELPADWQARAEEASRYVSECGKECRAEAEQDGADPEEIERRVGSAIHRAVNQKARIWRDVFEALSRASHGKCWYCESRQDRSDMRIDHFRPKNRIAESPDHPGYWWKAFDWRNLRLACTFCNERRRDLETGEYGGKADSFPIVPPPPYALSAVDPDESPMLADPACIDDVSLLTFIANGQAKPRASDANSLEYRRAETSIEKYHLNLEATRRHRVRVRISIQRLVGNIESALGRGDVAQGRLFVEELLNSVRGHAEHSAAARAFLGAYRESGWVNRVFESL
jgi:uncharacterized protein (TIGR02646 family)